jgi:hypothetical protein
MNDLLTQWFGSSWRSTIGGILIGIPPLVSSALVTANIPVGKWAGFAMTLSLGLGGLMLGVNAKDKQVHSTVAEVESSVGHDNTPPAVPPIVPPK